MSGERKNKMSGNIIDSSFIAGEDFTGYQNRAVMLDGDKIKQPADEDSVLTGILLNEPEEKEAGRVALMGLTKGVAGDTVTQNVRLKVITVDDGQPLDTGKFIPADNGDVAYFRAMEGGAKDELISILATGAGTKL